MEKVLAAVKTGASSTEIREFPMPDIPEDGALMKVAVAGICGTDVKMYKQPLAGPPIIMGHENIGYIAKAGRTFTERKGFKEGDLVFVEHYVACFKCEWCHQGQYRHCEATDWRYNPDAIRYGYTSAERPPHLWGGFVLGARRAEQDAAAGGAAAHLGRDEEDGAVHHAQRRRGGFARRSHHGDDGAPGPREGDRRRAVRAAAPRARASRGPATASSCSRYGTSCATRCAARAPRTSSRSPFGADGRRWTAQHHVIPSAARNLLLRRLR